MPASPPLIPPPTPPLSRDGAADQPKRAGRPLRLLVCAFGPFPGVAVNPSEQVARDVLRLARPALAAVEITFVRLPTRWDALGGLDALLQETRPDGVLLFGVAARRRRVNVETLAQNAARPAPDAVRRHPAHSRLDAAGPATLRTTAATAGMVTGLARRGIPVAPSRDAGRYLCNASYFHALAAARARTGATPPVLFVHLPGRNGRPRGIGRDRLARGLSALLVELTAQARRRRSKRENGGFA